MDLINSPLPAYTLTVTSPHLISPHLAPRWMYWTDWVQNLSEISKIERSYLDGRNRSSLVSTDILWVNGLSLDYTNDILYWCDAYYDRIESISLNCEGDACRRVSRSGVLYLVLLFLVSYILFREKVSQGCHFSCFFRISGFFLSVQCKFDIHFFIFLINVLTFYSIPMPT